MHLFYCHLTNYEPHNAIERLMVFFYFHMLFLCIYFYVLFRYVMKVFIPRDRKRYSRKKRIKILIRHFHYYAYLVSFYGVYEQV